ncbi:MAG: ABC transporter permease, partial [Acidimicrobiia bacterium]
MSTRPASSELWTDLAVELRKIPAFMRRDLLTSWSYRVGFFSDWLSIGTQLLVFYFIDRLVAPQNLPLFGGRAVSYIEFVAVGLVVASFIQVALGRVMAVMREEQLMGTLEALLTTPTATATIQLGSAAYDLIYVPFRSFVFLVLVSSLLGVSFHIAGFLPVIAILLAFIPFAWGIGVIGAAAVLTFRRSGGAVGIGVSLLTIAGGAYFPIEVLPSALQGAASLNPIAIAMTGTRDALLGGAGWREIVPDVLALIPSSIISLTLGMI